MLKLLQDPLFLVAFCIVLGQVVGSWKLKYFKLGSSATLFIGLLLSYFVTGRLGVEVKIPSVVFSLSLIGFIASVGLGASQNIRQVLKSHGIRFMVLSIVVTLSGALATYVFAGFFEGMRYSIIGTYVGALTSSPGLATALELAKGTAGDQSAAVGLGYAIAYVPGILIVILFAQLMGRMHRGKASEIAGTGSAKGPMKPFLIMGFFMVVFIGIILGSFEMKLGASSVFSLGMTGGVLFSALVFGSFKHLRYFDFDSRHLGLIRDVSLNMFLAIVGLNYGYEAFSAVQEFGLQLLLIGLITGVFSIAVGYIIGKHVLKIESVYLVGGICGGMTSTPGLAAAIDEFGSEEVTAGYGATYPFALLLMIVFTKLLFVF